MGKLLLWILSFVGMELARMRCLAFPCKGESIKNLDDKLGVVRRMISEVKKLSLENLYSRTKTIVCWWRTPTWAKQTEWIELVDNKYNFLAGAESNKILKNFDSINNQNADFSVQLYGNGNASEIISNTLLQ
jgi:hypothetical protein